MKIVDGYKLKVVEKTNSKTRNGVRNIEYKEKICDGVITGIDEDDITKDGILVLPNKVEYIASKYGKSIISNSTNKLKKIVIPSSFKSFGKSAFVDEKNLQCIEILDNDNEINFDCDAFSNCDLKKLNINKALNISEGTFFGNKKLKIVKINNLNNLESHSFSMCTNLESVTINNNPKYVQGADFECCTNIKEMTLGYGYKLQLLYGGNSDYSEISKECFNGLIPFKVTYILNMDKTKDEYNYKNLEKIICKLARKQFFEIDGYNFQHNQHNNFMEEIYGTNIYDISYRLSRTEFYFKIIFKDKEELLLPINDYFSEQEVSSDKVLQKIRN